MVGEERGKKGKRGKSTGWEGRVKERERERKWGEEARPAINIFGYATESRPVGSFLSVVQSVAVGGGPILRQERWTQI